MALLKRLLLTYAMYFIRILLTLVKVVHQHLVRSVQCTTYKDYFDSRHATAIFLHPTDKYEVLEAINKLNNHKSPGATDIPVKII